MTEPLEVTEPAEEPAPQTEAFYGRTFKANPDVSSWDTMEFFAMLRDAHEDPESLNPAVSMLQLRDFAVELVHPDDRDAFKAHARKNRASEEALLEFVGIKAATEAERPTVRSGDSSPGPVNTEPKSGSNSGGKDSAPTGPGFLRDRPDLALIVVESRGHEIKAS